MDLKKVKTLIISLYYSNFLQNIALNNNLRTNLDYNFKKEARLTLYNRGTELGDDNLNTLSSRQAEILSLSIEVLLSLANFDNAQDNYLLIDEPDLHLHSALSVDQAIGESAKINWPENLNEHSLNSYLG